MKGRSPASVDRNVQLPGIHAMVNDVVSTSDALDRLRLGESQRRKAPKLENRNRLQDGPLPLPSYTDSRGETSYPNEYQMNGELSLPAPVEPSYKEEINSSYYQYWNGWNGQPDGGATPFDSPQRGSLSASPGPNGPNGPNGIGLLNMAPSGMVPHGTTNGHHIRTHGRPNSISSHSDGSSSGPSGTSTSTTNNSTPNSELSQPEDADPPVKRRTNLPKDVTNTLKAWLNDHVENPYPSEDDKHRLMQETGLTMAQVSNWFINARRRVLNSSQRRGKYRSSRTSGYSP